MKMLWFLALGLASPALADELAVDRLGPQRKIAMGAGSGIMAPSSASIHKPSGYIIGDGIDLVTGEDKGVCLAPGYTQPPEPSKDTPVAAQEIDFRIDRVDDSQTLASTIKAGASGSIAAGFGSGNAGVDWLSEHALNTYSLYLLVSVSVSNSDRLISNEDLDPDRAALLKQENGDQAFRQQCGDAYVRGMASGGRFYALYELRTRSESDRQVLSTAISAQGVTGSWKVAAQFSSAITKASHLSEVYIQTFYQGPAFTRSDAGFSTASVGTPDTYSEIPNDPDDIIKFATRFPGLVANTLSWDYEAITKNYSTLKGWPSGRVVGIGFQKDALASADSAFLLTATVLRNVAYIEVHPGEFDMSTATMADVGDLEKKILDKRAEIAKKASACASGGQCEEIGTSPIYDVARQLPSRKDIKVLVGACGNDGRGRSRWATIGPGCRDLNSGITWSPALPGVQDYDAARQRCSDYVQNGVSGWVLPNTDDLLTLVGPDGIESQLPGDYDQWFWASDKKRVSPHSGFSFPNDARLTLHVMCRYIGI
jgi:hypothetical protein